MGSREHPAEHDRIEGLEFLDKVIDIDQSPIGRTPRSNPATYTGAFTPIRDWFAGLPEAKARGYQPGPLLLQRQGRPLRGLPGRRRHQDRDALPAGRLRHLRRLPRQALQSRDAGGAVQGQVDRRRARHDGRGRRRLLRGRARRARQAGDAEAGRPRLYPCRPAGDDAVGRRGAAHQARQGTVAQGDRPDALHPRRADHRPAFPRRRQAARSAARAGRPGQHGGRHRAQSRSHQDRRLDHRPRPRRRRRRRRAGRGRPAGGHRRASSAAIPASSSRNCWSGGRRESSEAAE